MKKETDTGSYGGNTISFIDKYRVNKINKAIKIMNPITKTIKEKAMNTTKVYQI